MQFRDYGRVLRRGWPLMALLTLVGVLVGAGAASVQPPVYVATAKAYVSVASSANAGDLVNSAQYTQQIAASFADIAGTAYVLKPVIARLGLHTTPAELAGAVTVTAATDEAVLVIRATDSSPVRAAAIANAIASRLPAAVGSLTPAGGRVNVTVVDPAMRPAAPVSPVPLLDIGAGAGAGLLLGVLLAALRVLSDTRLRTARDVRDVTTVPVIGSTPLDSSARRHPVVVTDDPQGVLAESYRSLRAALQFLDVDEDVRSIVVTSSVESEGKTFTAVNLAVALADAGERVLLVDADLRRPSVARSLRVEGSIGLTDVLIDRVRLEQAVRTDDDGLLSVLPSGPVPPNPNELLQSRALERLLVVAERHYDRLVIDTPPVLSVSDAAIVARGASGALLVVGSSRVRRAQLLGALDVFRQLRAPLLGIALTMVPPRDTDVGAYRHTGGRTRSLGGAQVPVFRPLTAAETALLIAAQQDPVPTGPAAPAAPPAPPAAPAAEIAPLVDEGHLEDLATDGRDGADRSDEPAVREALEQDGAEAQTDR